MSVWMQNPQGYGAAAGPVFQSLYEQPGQFATAFGNVAQGYMQGLGGLGQATANAYGAYGAGLGSVATARANEAGARYGANALAEAARQAGVSNIGSAALGAFGGASNSALAAWAANQQAYNNAAASMHNANQQGMSQYGQSRNAALGNLGNAYAGIGRAQLASNALSNFSFDGSMGGGSFNAAGPGGPVASGSYGAGGGFNFSGGGSRSGGGGEADGALARLGGLRGDLMAGDITGSLDRGADAGRRQLDTQHYSSREMPSQMLGQMLSGLMQLSGPAYAQSGRGMDQFYANTQMDERPYQGILDRLTSGYGSASSQLGGLRSDMRSGFGSANSNIQRMWDNSLGRLPEFQTPAQREIAARQGREEQQRSRDAAQLARFTRLANDPMNRYRDYFARRVAALRQGN
jgi:hypothetical protein